MTQEIDVQTLQDWLAEQKPVTVLDIRQPEDREQWWIPGSRHVDAYRSLKEDGSAGPLLSTNLPAEQPVVTVCGSGRVSLAAAEALTSQRGISALSLHGGMKAWSLAWNTARGVFGPIEVTQVRRTGKGCLSYLIPSGSEVAVIDPSVEPEVYLSLARNRNARIRYVLDTHVHADHLSRARRLAELSSAELVLPRQDRVRYSYTPASEGDQLPLGTTRIEVLHTPGHTSESVTYLVPEVGIFTGDTLFLSGVGRPDLHADQQETETRACLLYKSLKRLASLDSRLMVFPGHTSKPVPFDGQLLTAPLGDVANMLGEWLASENEFAARILARIPPTPPNYVAISKFNECGEWPEDNPADLEAGANHCAVS